LYGRLGGSQGHFGWVQKILAPTGIRSLDHPVFEDLNTDGRTLGLNINELKQCYSSRKKKKKGK
jgi:hypothetical protein